VYTQETVDALYAFTECEKSIAVSCIVIKDNRPIVATVSQILAHNTDTLVEVLRAELRLEEGKVKDKLHARTLEQIFIENRIYKRIEDKASSEGVMRAVHEGLKPFKDEIKREVTDEDVETLLKIPIRRISLYDINRAKKEIAEMNARLKEIKHHLANIKEYATSFLEGLIARCKDAHQRKTKLVSFTRTDVREAAQRNLKLRYDRDNGYLGYEANGGGLFDVSQYDRILVIRKTGAYSVQNVPDKLFVDKGMYYCGLADKDELAKVTFTVVYKDNETGHPYIKRCQIDQFILNKGYSIVPENCTPIRLTTAMDGTVDVEYKPAPRIRVLNESFKIKDYLVKGVKSKGVRLAPREVKSARFVTKDGVEAEA